MVLHFDPHTKPPDNRTLSSDASLALFEATMSTELSNFALWKKLFEVIRVAPKSIQKSGTTPSGFSTHSIIDPLLEAEISGTVFKDIKGF